MKVLILTEGGKSIGAGHLARCSALYQACEEKGANVELVINGDDSVSFLLNGMKYQLFNWLKAKQRLAMMLADADCVIIDSYLASRSLFNKISGAVAGRVIMIDDLNRLAYPAGIVVNPSIYGHQLKYPKNKKITYLLSKDYVILRKPFWSVPAKKIKRNARNILIILGGGFQGDFLRRIIKYLSVNFPSFTYHVVAPDFHDQGDLDLDINFYTGLSAWQMRGLMLKCDFSISAGGQTLYELVRVGVPVIAICLAENQLTGLRFFHRLGAIAYAGWINENRFWHRLGRSFEKFLSYKERRGLVKQQKLLIDGQGAKRLAKVGFTLKQRS